MRFKTKQKNATSKIRISKIIHKFWTGGQISKIFSAFFLYWSSGDIDTRKFVTAPVFKNDIFIKIKTLSEKNAACEKNFLDIFDVAYFDQRTVGISQCHCEGWSGDPDSGHTSYYH